VAVSILIPIMAFGLPIMDALLAMIRRFLRALHVWETMGQGTYRVFFLRGKAMFEADRDHIHHRLMRLGIHHRNAVIFLYAICAAMSVATLVIASYSSINTGMVLAAKGLAVILGIRKLRYEELQILQEGGIEELIIATTKLPLRQLEQVKELCRQHDVTLRQFRVSIEEIPHSPQDVPLYASG